MCFLSKTEKSKHHDLILLIRISLGTTFQLKLKILIFWNKFPQDGLLLSKAETVNTTIEFCILELVYNNFYNTLRLFYVLPNFPFTKSETMHDS